MKKTSNIKNCIKELRLFSNKLILKLTNKQFDAKINVFFY